MSLQFLHPSILWGLTALLIPIIIYLFNFKKFNKIYFSNLRFLKNLHIENKRKSKLKKWLIVFFRLLALTCIIIAFSQPYFPNINTETTPQQSENFAIYIDNSFSMNAETENGNALEVAKNKAFELINSFPNYSKIRIYTNDITSFSSNLNKEQAIARIQEINPSPTPVFLSDQIKKISINNKNKACQLYVFSDFQKSQSDIDNITQNKQLTISFLPLAVQKSNNLLIDSCWFDKPYNRSKHPQEISIRIKNQSNQNYEKLPIKLSINDSTKTVSGFSIEKNASHIVKLKYINHHVGLHNGKIEIKDFPITYDNQLFFSYWIDDTVNILAINQNEPNYYLTKLFSSSDSYRLKNIPKSKIFNENTKAYRLIIVNELLEIESGLSLILTDYLKNGGNIIYIPGAERSLSVNQFLDKISAPVVTEIDSSLQSLATIELQSDLYQNVFKKLKKNARLPNIFRYFKLNYPKNHLTESLWRTRGGDDLLTKTSYETGYFYLLSMQLKPNWTNLMMHPLFVPTFINLTHNNGNANNLYNILGSNTPIIVNRKRIIEQANEPLHIINKALDTDIIPIQKNKFDKGILLYPQNQIKKANNYQITFRDSVLLSCSFNYSRKESEESYYSSKELKEAVNKYHLNISIISPLKVKLSELYNEQSNSKQYWKTFIILCLLFVLCETILHRIDFTKQNKS